MTGDRLRRDLPSLLEAGDDVAYKSALIMTQHFLRKSIIGRTQLHT
jgi:hypothetical protein